MSPANGKQQPSEGDQSDTAAKQNQVPEHNHGPAAEDHSQNPDQEPRWPRRLSDIAQRFARADVWLAIFTCIVAVETALTIWILSKTDDALHKTAEATNGIRQLTEWDDRAWMAPDNPIFDSNPIAGNPVFVKILYENAGRTPAADLKLSIFFDQEKAPESRSFADLELIQENFCETHPATMALGISYPLPGRSTLLRIKTFCGMRSSPEQGISCDCGSAFPTPHSGKSITYGRVMLLCREWTIGSGSAAKVALALTDCPRAGTLNVLTASATSVAHKKNTRSGEPNALMVRSSGVVT